MFILYRYIGFSVIRGFLLLALILVSLFAIIILIEELEEVGSGGYTWVIALEYVLLHTPKLLLDFAAVISLIGSIVALGALASHHELVAVGSLGISPRKVTTSVGVTAFILMLFVLLIAQYVIPATLHQAHVIKALAVEGQSGFIDDGGYWAQKDHRFLHVKEVRHGRTPAKIEIYEFDEDHNFLRHIYADYADVQNDRLWELHDVQVKELVDGALTTINLESRIWNSFLRTRQVNIIISSPETLSVTDLYRFVKGLKERDEQYYRYELIFWQKAMTPVSAIMMILLGMRFVFGSQRTTSMGKRVTLGVLAGIAFYVFTQVITHWGSTHEWNSIVTAVIPNVLVLILLVLLTFQDIKKTKSIRAT